MHQTLVPGDGRGITNPADLLCFIKKRVKFDLIRYEKKTVTILMSFYGTEQGNFIFINIQAGHVLICIQHLQSRPCRGLRTAKMYRKTLRFFLFYIAIIYLFSCFFFNLINDRAWWSCHTRQNSFFFSLF